MTKEIDFSASDPPEVKLRKQLQFFARSERNSGLDEDLVREKLRLRLCVEEGRIARRKSRSIVLAGIATAVCLGGLVTAITKGSPLCLIGGITSLIASFAVASAIADLITAAKQHMELELFADEQGVSR